MRNFNQLLGVKIRALPTLLALLMMLLGCIVAGSGPAAAAGEGLAMPIHGKIVTLPNQRSFQLRRAPSADSPQADVLSLTRLQPTPPLSVGREIDAFYYPATRTVSDVFIDSDSAAGLPNVRIAQQLDVGDPMPDLQFIDQDGHRSSIAAFRGKTVLLSFFYTRCPDREICPAISGKFAYLQTKIDASRTQLIELSVDPSGDSPRSLAAYAKTFGADATRWHLVVAQHHATSDALALFGLSNLEGNPGRFLHDDVLAFISPEGRVSQLISSVGWSPDDVLASIEHLNGFASNPFRRWQLAAISGLISACGGSVTAGVAVMDSVIFIVGVIVLGGILAWFGRRIWAK